MPAEGPGDEFRDRLRASIQERVDRELRAAFGEAEEAVASESDDAAVDELAGRTADLGELIAPASRPLSASGLTRPSRSASIERVLFGLVRLRRPGSR